MKPATGQLDDFFQKELPSLKLTFSHPKMDGWNTSFLLGLPMFRGENAVSFRESSMTSFPAGRGIQADGSAVWRRDGLRCRSDSIFLCTLAAVLPSVTWELSSSQVVAPPGVWQSFQIIPFFLRKSMQLLNPERCGVLKKPIISDQTLPSPRLKWPKHYKIAVWTAPFPCGSGVPSLQDKCCSPWTDQCPCMRYQCLTRETNPNVQWMIRLVSEPDVLKSNI